MPHVRCRNIAITLIDPRTGGFECMAGELRLDGSEIGSQRPPCRGLVGGQYQLRNQNGRVVKIRHSSVCSLSSVVLCNVLAHKKKHQQASEDESSNVS
jgi:hypothetical protein